MPVQNVSPNGAWQDPAFWSSGAVPTAADDVQLNQAVVAGAAGAVHSLAMAGSSLSAGASFAVARAITMDASSTLQVNGGGTIWAPTISGGLMDFGGPAYINSNVSGVEIDLSGGAISGTINNTTINLIGYGEVIYINGSAYNSTLNLETETQSPGNFKLLFSDAQHAPTITNVDYTDAIDLVGVQGVSASYDGATLAVTLQNNQVVDLKVAGPIVGLVPTLQSDGGGGTAITWTGSASTAPRGLQGDWSDGINWMSGSPPPAGADAVFNIFTDLAIHNPVNLHSLVLNESKLTVQSTLTVTGAVLLDSASTLTVDGGVVTAASIGKGQIGLLHGGAISGASSAAIGSSDGANSISGAITDSTVVLTSGSLELDGAVTGSTVRFGGPAATLILHNQATSAPLTDVSIGDVIDLAGVSATSATFDGATLKLATAGGGSLSLAVSGSPFDPLTGDKLNLAADGHGGTNIFWSAPAGPPTNIVASGDWQTAAVWSTGAVPTPLDDVTLSRANFTYSAVAAHSLTLMQSDLAGSGAVTVTGAVSLDAASALTIAGTLSAASLTGGHIFGHGSEIDAPISNATVNLDGKIVGALSNVTLNLDNHGTRAIELDGPATNATVVLQHDLQQSDVVAFDDPDHAAAISGMLPRDVIDLVGVAATSASYDGHTLAIGRTGGATLDLAVSGSLSGAVLQFAADGRGGTYVTWAPPPSAPSTPTNLADAGIDNGYVSAAANVASQTLTGDAPANTVVAVIDAGVGAVVGAAYVDASGTWSLPLGQLADGVHQLYAFDTDGTSVSPAGGPLTFTVDTVGPTPEVLFLASSGSGFTVYGHADPGQPVELFDNGAQVGAPTAGGDGIWSVTLALDPNTLHSFTEQSIDAAGNPGTSAGQTLFSPNAATLAGGAGDDALIAWGNQTLTGGAGHDRFVVDSHFTQRAITDFAPGTDVIELDGAVYHDFATLAAHAQQVAANTVITVDGEVLTLQNVTLASLHAADFLFL
jgi:hypothetical protein